MPDLAMLDYFYGCLLYTSENGEIVVVHDFDGYPMGKGFINTNSKIRIRMLTRHVAVSYTHLDVYKRQVSLCGLDD